MGGFDFSTSGMQAITKQMQDRSVFDSGSKQEVHVAQKAFASLRNFGRLREPVDFGGEGVDIAALSEAMLTFSSAPISKSLTKLDAEQDRKAVRAFQDILRRM